MCIAALFTVAKPWKPSNRPVTEDWMKRLWHVHAVEYYSAVRKGGTRPFGTAWMHLKVILLSEGGVTWYRTHSELRVCSSLISFSPSPPRGTEVCHWARLRSKFCYLCIRAMHTAVVRAYSDCFTLFQAFQTGSTLNES